MPASPPRAERSALVGFAHNPLNRLSDRRDDVAFIDDLATAPQTRCLVLAGDLPLVRSTDNAPDPLFTMAQARELGTPRERAFLGMSEEGALFAVQLAARDAEPAQADGLVQIDLRTLAAQGLVDPAIVGALGQAKSLMYWHARHRFCSVCGAPSRVEAAGWRRVCDACQAQHFPRTDPVVIMLAVEGDACLLGRQARFPGGMYSCLAGFVESGETMEDAVRRELFEEAGIACGRVDYLATQPWPFPASLMIGAIAHSPTRALVVDHTELDDARWFTREETRAILEKRHPEGITCPPKMAIAHHIMRAWVEG